MCTHDKICADYEKELCDQIPDYTMRCLNTKAEATEKQCPISSTEFAGSLIKGGAEPIPVFGELETIVKQRHDCCEDCKWHPDVCKHCLRSLDP